MEERRQEKSQKDVCKDILMRASQALRKEQGTDDLNSLLVHLLTSCLSLEGSSRVGLESCDTFVPTPMPLLDCTQVDIRLALDMRDNVGERSIVRMAREGVKGLGNLSHG